MTLWSTADVAKYRRMVLAGGDLTADDIAAVDSVLSAMDAKLDESEFFANDFGREIAVALWNAHLEPARATLNVNLAWPAASPIIVVLARNKLVERGYTDVEVLKDDKYLRISFTAAPESMQQSVAKKACALARGEVSVAGADEVLEKLSSEMSASVDNYIERLATTTWSADLRAGRQPKAADVVASAKMSFDSKWKQEVWAIFELRRRLEAQGACAERVDKYYSPFAMRLPTGEAAAKGTP